jgi:hypothetical protein
VRTSVSPLNRYRLGGSLAGAFMDCANAMPAAQAAAKPFSTKQAWVVSHTTGITPRPLVSQGRSTG